MRGTETYFEKPFTDGHPQMTVPSVMVRSEGQSWVRAGRTGVGVNADEILTS